MEPYTWLKIETSNGELIEVDRNEMIESYIENDGMVRYPSIPIHKRIIDFIKSWFYYPKLKRYAMEQGGWMKIYISNIGRFQYAWWHCRKGIYSGWWGK